MATTQISHGQTKTKQTDKNTAFGTQQIHTRQTL